MFFKRKISKLCWSRSKLDIQVIHNLPNPHQQQDLWQRRFVQLMVLMDPDVWRLSGVLLQQVALPRTRLQRLISTFGFSLLEYDLIHHNIPFALSPRVVCQRGAPAFKKIFFGRFSTVFTVALKLFPKRSSKVVFFFSTSSVLGCFFFF